jgi:hypothetical protein
LHMTYPLATDDELQIESWKFDVLVSCGADIGREISFDYL